MNTLSSLNMNGLDPNSISYQDTPGAWNQSYSGFGGQVPGYQTTANRRTATMNTPYGNLTAQGNSFGNDPYNYGSWQNASGATINDPAGYTEMLRRRNTGADATPYTNMLKSLVANPSSITSTPGYQFQLDQGNQAINRSAAAKGMLNSGNVLAELAKYGQGMASTSYDTQLNRLSNLQNSANQFGIQSGYYENPQNQAPFGVGNSVVTPYPKPSTW